ncbi:MAG: hypothetical protein KKF74_01560 [Nanoarchaeota archaeon]|nr:hypothetical protein [Nanoarchaeota archaeon]
MSDLIDKTKRYFSFNSEEIKGILGSTLIIAFIISFKLWGPGNEFNFAYGLKNLFNSILITLLAILVHISAQKIYGLHLGFKVEFKTFWPGLIIALILCFVSGGAIWFLIPGGIVLYHMAQHRLGFFRYGLNYWSLGMISAIGPLANVCIAALLAVIAYGGVIIPPMTPIATTTLVGRAISLNLWLAIFTMLPIPPLDGSNVFFASRLLYAFAFGCIVGYAMLVLFLGFYSLVFVILMGIIFWFITYQVMEKAG